MNSRKHATKRCKTGNAIITVKFNLKRYVIQADANEKKWNP